MRIVLIGGGKTVYFLTKRFLAKNFHVTVITEDGSEAQYYARELRARVLLGDGTSPILLRDAEATRADAVVALMSHDEDNLIACQIARRMFEVPQVVALVEDPENVDLFRRLGVQAAFSATDLVARVIEERTTTSDVLQLMPLADGRAHVAEIVLSEGAPGSGRRISELGAPGGALIATVFRGEELIVPSGSTTLQAGDRLVIVSQPQGFGPFLRLLLGEGA